MLYAVMEWGAYITLALRYAENGKAAAGPAKKWG